MRSYKIYRSVCEHGDYHDVTRWTVAISAKRFHLDACWTTMICFDVSHDTSAYMNSMKTVHTLRDVDPGSVKKHGHIIFGKIFR